MATTVIDFSSGTSGQLSETHQQTGASGAVLWTAIYDGSGDGASATIQAGWFEGENWNVQMWRSYLRFDTSVLNGSTPITAKIRISGTQYWRNLSESSQFGSMPAANYASLKTTTDYVELPIQGTGTGVGSQAFTDVDLTLTGAGLSNIDPSGTTEMSFRGTGDTTDRGTTVTDRYTYVIITAAALVITHNPIKIFDESVSIGEVFGRDKRKEFDEALSIGESVRIDGLVPGRSVFEGISIGETFSAGRKFEKTVSESIMIGEKVRRYINSVLVGKWKKVAKTITGWTEQAKTASSWRKTSKK